MATGLNQRARRILYALVTEYIATGRPVGSRTLAKRFGIDLSPATIRNVMSDLEELALVRQPHTSAGRVPTDAGFRLFVDALVELRAVSEEDRKAVREQLHRLERGDDVMRATGQILSALTGAAAVVTGPAPEDEPLGELRFLPLREGALLAILVSKSGGVENRVLEAAPGIGRSELERLNNYIASILENRSLRELRNYLERDMAEDRGVVRELSTVARSLVDATRNDSAEAPFVIEGQGLLFDRPEFGDVGKLREFLRAFDEKERILGLLERTLDAEGVQVIIGAEARMDPLKDIGVVSTHYEKTRGSLGSLAVVGPARLDYGRIVPLVEFTADAVSRRLSGEDEENEPD